MKAPDPILESFLQRQFEEGMALNANSDLVELMPVEGQPPTRYVACFQSRGLARVQGQIVEHDRWAVGIAFPPDYLRTAPHAGQMLTYLGSVSEPWHPNLRPPFICLELRAGTPLVDLLFSLHELFSWQSFSTGDDGLNPAASAWARSQPASRFPVDRSPLRRRVALKPQSPPAEASA